MNDDIKLVTLRTFDNPIDAHMVRSLLESNEITCCLFDEYISTLRPMYNILIGGIKLKIRSSDIEQAQQVLSEIDNAKLTDNNDKLVSCPKCSSTQLYSGHKSMKGVTGVLSAIISFAFMVYPIYYKTVIKCKECGYEF